MPTHGGPATGRSPAGLTSVVVLVCAAVCAALVGALVGAGGAVAPVSVRVASGEHGESLAVTAGPLRRLPEPVASGRSYAVATTKLANGRPIALRWNPCQEITYQVNVSAVPRAHRQAVSREIRVAVLRLAAATGLRFRYRGDTVAVPRTTTVDAQRAELVIAVTIPSRTDFPIGSGMLGYGGYRFWQWSTPAAPAGNAAIARGWVVLDRAGVMRLKPGFGAGTTRGNVMLHELAHSVGLEHVADPRQLLYRTLTPRAPAGYGPGDRAGLRQVGRASGCIAVPATVVRDLR